MQKKKKKIRTLVIPDRIHTRIQPEVYFAFESAIAEYHTVNEFRFEYFLFNPFMAKFQYPTSFFDKQIEFMKLLNSKLSNAIINIKFSNGDNDLWTSIKVFMFESQESCINKVYRELEKILIEFNFIVIESTARTAIHPFFYDNSLTDINYDYAHEYDLIDTLLGLFYIDIALKHNLLMFATCHGAQLSYIHAGGKLKRLVNPYYFVPETYYFPIRNPYDKNIIEVWQFNEDLMNARNIRNGSEYTIIKTPLPRMFYSVSDDKIEKFINRDFNQTLAMIGPEPDTLSIYLYHPLSLYEENAESLEIELPIPGFPEITKEKIIKFKKLLKSEVIVDAFTYGNIFAFQHHPHYVYNYGSNAEIFRFFIRKIIEE